MKKLYVPILIFSIYLSSFFIPSSLRAFDIELPDLTSESLNIVDGILNFFEEEDEYIKFQNINYLYNNLNLLGIH